MLPIPKNIMTPVTQTRSSYVAYAGIATIGAGPELTAITGAAGKIIRVTRVVVFSNATAARYDPIAMKRAASLPASPTAVAMAALDPLDPTPAAVVNQWAVAAVETGATGIVGVKRNIIPASPSGGIVTFDFGVFSKEAILRTATDSFFISQSAAQVTGDTLNVEWTWTEEPA